MIEKIDQRIYIIVYKKFCETCKDTYLKLQKMYGEDCMWHTQAYELFKHFNKTTMKMLESDEQCRRSTTSKNENNVECVHAAVLENCQIIIYELSEGLNISFCSVQSILVYDLWMGCVSNIYDLTCLLFMMMKMNWWNCWVENEEHYKIL